MKRLGGEWHQIEKHGNYLVDYNIITVKFLASTSAKEIEKINSIENMEVFHVDLFGYCGLQITDNSDPLDKVETYLASGLTELAEVNTIGNYFTNDPLYSVQWFHEENYDRDIDSPEAWELENGNPSIIIGILDSGTDIDHEDLARNIWINPDEVPSDTIDNDTNGFVNDISGWNFVNHTPDVTSTNFHGTHVAGIAVAETNNEVGVAGVAGGQWNIEEDEYGPGCSALICVIGIEAPNSFYVANAVNYCRVEQVDVITMSLGVGESAYLSQALADAATEGIFIDCSSGNADTISYTDVKYPANDPHVLQLEEQFVLLHLNCMRIELHFPAMDQN